MPLPTPKPDEDRNDYMSRCISFVIKEGTQPNTKKGRQIGAGMCGSNYDRIKGRRSRIKDGKLQYLNLRKAEIVFTENEKQYISQSMKELKASNNGILELPRSTLLVGDGLYNDVWHPKEEAAASFKSMDRQPFIIDHEDGVRDEIGWMKSPQYDAETFKLSAVPVLNLNTENGQAALGFIQNRILAGKVPETSVGFWATETTEIIKEIETLTARDWEFDHNSLVSRGACGPREGAGIGLKTNKKNNKIKKEEYIMTEEDGKPQDPIKDDEGNPEKITNADKKPNTDQAEKLPTREEFRKILKEELVEAEKEKETNKNIEAFKKAMNEEDYTKAAELNPFKDEGDGDKTELSKALERIDKLERGQSGRTTPTRDTMDGKKITQMDKGTKEYQRAKILTGRSICQYIFKHPNDRLELSMTKDDYDDIPDSVLVG